MKIDAVERTLFAWDDIPPTRYTAGSCSGLPNTPSARILSWTNSGANATRCLSFPPPIRRFSKMAGSPSCLSSLIVRYIELMRPMLLFAVSWRPVGESNPCFQRERLTS